MALIVSIVPPGSGNVIVTEVRQNGQRQLSAGRFWQWNGIVYQLQIQPRQGCAFNHFVGTCDIRETYYPPREETPVTTEHRNLSFNDRDPSFSRQGDVFTPQLQDLGSGLELGAMPAAPGAFNEYIDNQSYTSTRFQIVRDVNLTCYFDRVYTHLPLRPAAGGPALLRSNLNNLILRDD